MNNKTDQQTSEFETKSASERLEELNKLSPRDIELQIERAKIAAPEVVVAKKENKTPDKQPTRVNHKSINTKLLDESYSKIMGRVQTELPANSRLLSRIIHYKPIERTSDVISSTIARPNAILAGSIMAFILPLSLYVIAKTIGYSLSGSETILAFAIGWVIGITYDLTRSLFTSNNI